MNYDIEIEEMKSKKREFLNEMEIKKGLFLEELTKFTSNWFEKETLSTIKANAEKVVELGEEKARELKDKIKELKERNPELVYEYMADDQIWWHTNEDRVSYNPKNHSLHREQEKKIKLMFGELGSILIEYGLVKADSEYSTNYSSCWTYEGYSQNKKLKYGYGVSYSDKLYEINSDYLVLIRKAQEINKQIEDLEDKKKRENVEVN
ncbi:hypothetical protein ABE61_24245 [Lysinibacillus sphaericus]|uniref:hypothetical protein n=1 Tax=Lysinibacillus sphaericus TaxID=1421 RepID=UPI0018CDDFC1|nr:hypothetical protein [Lysinibacillus sphaericus]MBG9456998.1 hypothetical protein [Lysinibacillus sphaericus]MBG9480514.1 hypothetical protein [Lysinibacillus sphaericus]MBG9593006.1 hypothetical protein [Lysinibacillus sphaericus]